MTAINRANLEAARSGLLTAVDNVLLDFGRAGQKVRDELGETVNEVVQELLDILDDNLDES